MTRKDMSIQNKKDFLNMIYGGQKTEFDFHKAGFFFDYLKQLLSNYGFCDIQRVEYLGLFHDTSQEYILYQGVEHAFSLNVIAKKCLNYSKQFICL
jgi:hypothetical protein